MLVPPGTYSGTVTTRSRVLVPPGTRSGTDEDGSEDDMLFLSLIQADEMVEIWTAIYMFFWCGALGLFMMGWELSDSSSGNRLRHGMDLENMGVVVVWAGFVVEGCAEGG